MSVDVKGILEEHLRFARRPFSHVSLQFLLSDLLKNLFDVSLEDIVLGLEKDVKSTIKGFRGKMDLLFRNIIFEVKRDLERELEDGEKQLERYFQALQESEPNIRNVGLITDCIRFIQYVPVIKDSEVEGIREISAINLEKDSHRDVVLWLDSILFSKPKISPNADDLKFRFGLGSPTYAYVLQEIEKTWAKIKERESTKIKLRLWNKHMEIVYGKVPTESGFLEQTYLVILVKLIVYVRIRGLANLKGFDAHEALTGEYFRSFGALNLVEEGYYSWILDEEIYAELKPALEALLKEITRYDTTQIDEDLFKEIYQEIVRKEDRHRVGEYYTPEWLAELTLIEALKQHKVVRPSETPSILDPACGSGTFLTNAIRILKEKLSKEDPSQVLETILAKVQGADINPLAVYIARANYTFALGDLLAFKKDMISIPIYVADTFQIADIEDIVEAPKRVYEIDADGKPLSIPYSILREHSKFREAIMRLERAVTEYIIKGTNHDTTLIHLEKGNSLFSQKEINVLRNSLKTLLSLIDEGRDSVWLFMLSNVLAPIIFRQTKFDIIVGNPPWIAMRFIENVSYQEYVKSRVFRFGLMDSSKTQLFSNMEMATVFFSNSADLYLKEGGTIAFVMPRSILTGALQHVQFRKFKHPRLKLMEILDFEDVAPLFNVPSCVILCKKEGESSYPAFLRKFSGSLESRNLRLAEAKHQLNIQESSYAPPILEGQKSPYYFALRMGARLAPRPFWFVDFVSHPILRINPKTPKVKTTEESRRQAKGKWNRVELEGNVEADYIFATLLSKDLLPFGYTEMRPVIVPGEPKRDAFRLLNVANLRGKGSFHVAEWLEKVEMLWKKYRSTKAEKNFPSVLDRVDYQKLFSLQNPSKRYILLYVASGTYIVANVVDRNSIPDFTIDQTTIKPKEFVVESKTWFYESDNENEVHYLCSILNSRALSREVNKLQTRGLWGVRDIHRRPFLFSIPLYKSANKSHKRLAEIGKEAHRMVSKVKKIGKSKGISGKRRKIQKNLFAELKEIDEIVSEILNL